MTCPAGERIIYKTTAERVIATISKMPEWEESKERINQHQLTPKGKATYKRRKETVERSFADAKQLHDNRYACYTGLNRVQGQSLMAAAAQNIIKIAQMVA